MAHGNYQNNCGWDEELFFDGQPLEDYICGICLNVLKYPQRLNCGGAHNFCAGCLRQYEEANIGRPRNCPACRRDNNFYAPNLTIHANIGLLRVHCPNEQYGCNAVVSLYQLETHKNRTCGHLPIQCEQGCGPRHPNIPHTADVCLENLRNMVAERQLKVDQQVRIADERRRDTEEMQQQRDAARNDAARYRYQRNWYREDFNRLQTEYEELDELHTDTARRLQRMEVLARQRQELITDLAGRLRRYTPYDLRSRSVVAPNIRPRSLFEHFLATSPQPGQANDDVVVTPRNPRAQPDDLPVTPRILYNNNGIIIEEVVENEDQPQPPAPGVIEIVEISSDGDNDDDDDEEVDDQYDYVEADSP